jgi:hypothetical protein
MHLLFRLVQITLGVGSLFAIFHFVRLSYQDVKRYKGDVDYDYDKEW